MDSLLSSLDPFVFAPLEGLWALVAGLDQQWKLVLVGVALLMLLLLRFRARFTTSSAHRDLQRHYRKLVKDGFAEWQLPYCLLKSREEWDALPEDFLMELAARLEKRDRVIDFIILVEGDDFDREGLVRLTYFEPDRAMRELSVLLTDHAGELPIQEAIGALDQALQIDPENHLALIDLATQHYAAKRYAIALPLLEQAMTLSQQTLPQLRAAAGRKQHGAQAASAHSLHGVLKLLGEMYADCVEQVGAKAA